MTILSTIQDACKDIGVTIPDAVFTSTTREHVEIRNLANEMAQRIAQAHDWRLFRTLATITGDGTTEDWDFPSDYDRMLKSSDLWSSNYATPLTHIDDTNTWLEMDIRQFAFVIGAWTIIGDQIHIKPASAVGETVKYYYASNAIVAPASGSNKTMFTADDDTFRLNERTLRLGIIWQWKANKGQSYAEHLRRTPTPSNRILLMMGAPARSVSASRA